MMMSSGTRTRFLCITCIAGLALSTTAPAQIVVDQGERLDPERPEAWAMAYLGATTLFSGFGPARRVDTGSISVGAELGHVPHVSTERRRVGFDGTKLEDLNKIPAFGRLRVGVGLPADFHLELGWTPPVRINGAKPRRVAGLALERPLYEDDRWRVGARAFHQRGHISGDFTCDRATAAHEPGSPGNPFGCRAPSNDRFTLDLTGLELSASRRFMADRLEPYVTWTVTRMNPRTQVRARTFNVLDRSLLTTRMTTRTATLGAIYRPADNWEMLAAMAWTPLDVRRPPDRQSASDDLFSARIMLRRRLR